MVIKILIKQEKKKRKDKETRENGKVREKVFILE